MYNNNFNRQNYGYPYDNTYNSGNQIKTYSFVNGMEGANAYPIMPGTSMLLMDTNKPICYMKTADNIGKYTVRYFELKEIDANTAKSILEPEVPPQPEYVSKEDFMKLNSKFDELLKRLDSRPNRKEPKEVNNG